MSKVRMVILVAAALVLGLIAPLAAAPEPDVGQSPSADPHSEGRTVERVSGPGRVETSVAVSQAGWDSADTALLATAGAFPDALAAGALAASLDAPLLLSAGDSLHPDVQDELLRLDVGAVVILGGEGAVPPEVEQEIGELGPETSRLAGETRFDTAEQIAVAAGAPAASVSVASGEAFPDALSAASLAATPQQSPTLLAQFDSVPPATGNALAELEAEAATVVGGTAALDNVVVDELVAEGIDASRVSGDGRFTTSIEVVITALARFDDDPRPLLLATGEDFPDALAAGGLAAQVQGPLLLVPSGSLTDELFAFISEHRERFSDGIVLGGTQAVSDEAMEEIHAALNGEERPEPEPEPAEWQLRTDGLGVVPFGTDFDDAYPSLVERFGHPTIDEGWQPTVPSSSCTHPEERTLWLDGLIVTFVRGGGGDLQDGMMEWTAMPQSQTPPLETANGFRVGSTNAELVEAFPDVVLNADPELGHVQWTTAYTEPDQGTPNSPFHGFSIGDAPNEEVQGMWSIVCGVLRVN